MEALEGHVILGGVGYSTSADQRASHLRSRRPVKRVVTHMCQAPADSRHATAIAVRSGTVRVSAGV